MRLWGLAVTWIVPFYDGLHLARAGYWVCNLDPYAPEPVIIATLTHDMERSVPGEPVIDKRRGEWDDPTYNDAHCLRSVEIVQRWLRGHGASREFVAGVETPIREHEFGGSDQGNLAQAADSLSFLEICFPRVAGWIDDGECDLDSALRKVDFMFYRIRLESAREIAAPFYDDFRARLKADDEGQSTEARGDRGATRPAPGHVTK